MQPHQQQEPSPFQYAPGQASAPKGQLHAGVGKFMTGVFGWMAAGLGVSAVAAMLVASSPLLLQLFFGTPLRWVLLFAPLAFVWIFGSKIHNMSPGGAKASFLSFAALVGAGLAPIVIVYTSASIFATFLVTSVMFGAMALFGWATKRDLSAMGRFLFMGVIGLMVAWMVSIFIPGVYFWVAAIGVPIFAGLTAYDTQKLKQVYMMHGGRGNLAIFGALELYLDFINMFLFLLRLFGDRE